MNATEFETSPITVRLEPELADFVRGLAKATCNTSAGALRLCVRTLKESGLPIAPAFLNPAAGPELAKAG